MVLGEATDIKMRGVYVKLRVDVATKKYHEIRFIQLVRQVTKDPDIVPMDPINETWRERSGWKTGDAPSQGWRVDQVPLGKDAYWRMPGNRKYGSTYRIEKDWSLLYDPAAYQASRFPNAGMEFISAAIGIKEGKEPEYLGSVRWGFLIDNGNVDFHSSEGPKIDNTVPPELGHALYRWNSIRGNELIEKIKGVKIAHPPKNP